MQRSLSFSFYNHLQARRFFNDLICNRGPAFHAGVLCILALLILVPGGGAWAQSRWTKGDAADQTGATASPTLSPLSSILKPDGSVDRTKSFSGSLDAKGYRMVTSADGTPQFVPPDQTQSAFPNPEKYAESDSSDAYWDDQFPTAGASTTILAAAADGFGNIYIGGAFTSVGNVLANGIAKWDGTSWSAVGSGIGAGSPPTVRTILAVAGDIYVGGSFTTAGGVSANNIAKWNGTSWSALGSGLSGGSPTSVEALEVIAGDLYVGGSFTTAGGVSANSIAKWNGTSWSTLGSGMSGGYVYTLTVSGSDLYAGGFFTTAGGASANHIAKWNGTSWSALGSGMDNSVYTLAAITGDIYAGGRFTTAGGASAIYIAKWNGTSWSALGTGMSGPYVYALVVSGSDLYVGGWFTTAGGVSANNIAKWNGTSWSAVGTGMSGGLPSPRVTALTVSGGDVYAGGDFTMADGLSANRFAKWNGASWSALGTGMAGGTTPNPVVIALTTSGGDIYAGGTFLTAGGVRTNGIAKWNGTSWSALGTGMGSGYYVFAIAGSENDIYAGGGFTSAGGNSANNIAKWNGTSWSALGSGAGNSTQSVKSIAVAGTDVYVGGTFTTAGGTSANYIAKWNGTSWSALGSGMSGASSTAVDALAVSGSELYAGGYFTTAGGVSASNIAKWNGTSWSALGSGVNGAGIWALAVSGSDLYAGGAFSTAGGVSANYIAKWNGISWSALGSGIDPPTGPFAPPVPFHVRSLAVSGSDVYAGGVFETVSNGLYANNIAKWNGTSWSALGSGIGGSSGNYGPYVWALEVRGNSLYAGGSFTTAGGKDSAYFALWQPRVNATTAVVSAAPGAMTIGDDVDGFYRPALITAAGTTVSYGGGLPATVTLDRADEIHVNGMRVNGAFTLAPEGMQFGGDGATLRVEFSQDDVALFGGSYAYTDFRAARLSYPPNYPTSKEAAQVTDLGLNVPVPIRIENGKQIYAVTVPFPAINSTYGAVPQSFTGMDWEVY